MNYHDISWYDSVLRLALYDVTLLVGSSDPVKPPMKLPVMCQTLLCLWRACLKPAGVEGDDEVSITDI